MKKIIHVNQHKIRSNTKNGTDEPVLTVKTYKENKYAHEAIIKTKDGKEIAKSYLQHTQASELWGKGVD